MMQTIDRVTAIYFSPTHTSRSIARGIAAGTNHPVTEIDITHQDLPSLHLHENELLLIAVPVYGGVVAPIALQRLEELRGNGCTPAVATVVYGNRDFGKSATQLASFLTQRGFCVVGAAAFVGEHSYHSAETPIAAGRPLANDLQEAKAFGAAIWKKLKTGKLLPINVAQLRHPSSGLFNILRFILFVIRYQRRQRHQPVKVVPKTDPARCNACGRCVRECPVQAIDSANPLVTEASRCIKCAACVKGCPQQARSLATPFAPVLSRNFGRSKPNVTLL